MKPSRTRPVGSTTTASFLPAACVFCQMGSVSARYSSSRVQPRPEEQVPERQAGRGGAREGHGPPVFPAVPPDARPSAQGASGRTENTNRSLDPFQQKTLQKSPSPGITGSGNHGRRQDRVSSIAPKALKLGSRRRHSSPKEARAIGVG